MIKREIRILGLDDAPFKKFSRGSVLVVGTVFRGGTVLDGIISCKVRIDGTDATEKLAKLINRTKHRQQLQVIMMKGIAVGGFNVIDINELSRRTGLPVIVVIKKYPDFKRIARALERLPNKKERLETIKRAGEIHKIGGVFVQLAGIKPDRARDVLKISTTRGLIPEPIRTAHLIASGVTVGESRGRA